MKKLIKQPVITGQIVREKYFEAVNQFKDKKRKEFKEFRTQQIELCIQEVEKLYKTHSWRGTIPFKDLKIQGGCLFIGIESCKIINMTNEGFEFSGDRSKNVKLRDLPTKTIYFLGALIDYMNNSNKF